MEADNEKVAALSHKGSLTRPSTADLQEAVRNHAIRHTSRDHAVEWAKQHHDSLNGQDRGVAERALEELRDRDADRQHVVARLRGLRDRMDPWQRFVTSEKVAPRYVGDLAFAWAGIAFVLLVCWVEPFLVSRYVITSGVFGLIPSNWSHVLFAFGYAALPLAGAFIWRLYVVNQMADAQARACERLKEHAKRLVWIWVVVFALVVGPSMLTLEGAADPYDGRPDWVATVSIAAAGLLAILRDLAAFTIIALLAVSLLAASAIIATILVNDRRAAVAARVTEVRESEEATRARADLADLHRERLAALRVIGDLEGFLEAMTADRMRFAEEFADAVESVRLRGTIAAQQTMLGASSDNKVVPLGGQR